LQEINSTMNYPDLTLSQIVTDQFKAAAVFEKYSLDFCCKGKITLKEACQTKGIPLEAVVEELERVLADGSSAQEEVFKQMTASQLIDYIVLRHHFYVRQAIPLIYSHLQRVTTKHGETFPWMHRVFNLFVAVADELNLHMKKEEEVLFPAIKQKEQAMQQGDASTSFGIPIKTVLMVMEKEHEQSGEWMDHIRRLTNNYLPPMNACTTHRICLAELKEFEEDLHRHVHLENYMLFPKALEWA
jgi:regulator of cell morphogenesis and NO signaling